MISVNYKYDKVLLYIILSLILSALFLWGFFNAEELALKEVKSGRHSLIKKLFYKNEQLISVISIIFAGMFIWFSIHLASRLIWKKVVFGIENEAFYKNNKRIISINNIEKFEFRKVQNNTFIMIHLNDYKQFINESNFFSKIRYQTLKLTKEKTISINITFLDTNPQTLLKSFQKLTS